MPCTFFLPVLFTIFMLCGHSVSAKKVFDNKKDSDFSCGSVFCYSVFHVVCCHEKLQEC